MAYIRQDSIKLMEAILNIGNYCNNKDISIEAGMTDSKTRKTVHRLFEYGYVNSVWDEELRNWQNQRIMMHSVTREGRDALEVYNFNFSNIHTEKEEISFNSKKLHYQNKSDTFKSKIETIVYTRVNSIFSDGNINMKPFGFERE